MRLLNLQLYGPCDEHDGILPNVNDSIAVIRGDGRVSVLTVTKVEPALSGVDIWAGLGERFRPSDCYLIYTVYIDSV